jgi:hypothetical protein
MACALYYGSHTAAAAATAVAGATATDMAVEAFWTNPLFRACIGFPGQLYQASLACCIISTLAVLCCVMRSHVVLWHAVLCCVPTSFVESPAALRVCTCRHDHAADARRNTHIGFVSAAPQQTISQV